MALIPIFDRNPRVNVRFHYVTAGLMLANALVFFYEQSLPFAQLLQLVHDFGLRPAVLFGAASPTAGVPPIPEWAALLSYQFLHSGWDHFLFNMLYLWVFGDNIEDAMGHGRFLIFYLACGIVAGLVQAAADVTSVVPVIGASGAIAGALGAYFILHPRARVWSLLFWVIPLPVPAVIVLSLFFAQNLLLVFGSGPGATNVAVWAHLAGFIAGMALIGPMRYRHVKLWHRPASPWKRRRRK